MLFQIIAPIDKKMSVVEAMYAINDERQDPIYYLSDADVQVMNINTVPMVEVRCVPIHHRETAARYQNAPQVSNDIESANI
jgi:hypothetical protein